LAKKLNVEEAVIFDTRYIPDKDLASYFSCSDVLLLPYSRRVGPSGPLAIAASYGLPTIMTIDEKFALSHVVPFVKLVPPRDCVALANAIGELLKDGETRQEMVQTAIAFSSKYSYDNVAKQHILAYCHILGRA